MVKHCHFNMIYFRTTCVFSGIMTLAYFGIYGVDGTPTVILATYPDTQNTTVVAGSDVVLECTGSASGLFAWYKVGSWRKYVADFQGKSGPCGLRLGESLLPGLSLGNEDCSKHALKISNISNEHDGIWKCTHNQLTRRIHVHVVAPTAEQTTLKTTSLTSSTRAKVASTSTAQATTTSSVPGQTTEVTTTTSSSTRAKVASTSTAQTTTTSSVPGSTHSTNKPTTSVTVRSSPGYKIQSRTKDSTNPQTPPVNSMLPLLGGTIGGALFLLAAVIAVCCLLRSRKQRHTDGSAERPGKGHQRNQDPEQGEDDVMVGNPIYSSYDGGVDYAQIGGARQTASTKDSQASPGTSQEVADIYAIPDKQRPSTLKAEAVACDVYSVVQKQPKSEGQGMSHQPTDKDDGAAECDVYSVVQKQPQ
ncbi:endochitinase A-like [Haliotis rufescens]|uniref:endochitinase A-like n=1 Tax=Haliotis rufescens TaxID=6454 RepID=UPI00201F6D48|nr:endochitinase A-like [Haliotis rufescens]